MVMSPPATVPPARARASHAPSRVIGVVCFVEVMVGLPFRVRERRSVRSGPTRSGRHRAMTGFWLWVENRGCRHRERGSLGVCPRSGRYLVDMPETPDQPPHDATLLLERVGAGDRGAAEALFPLVYDQLRAIAGGQMKAQRPNHTLQPTALVHEAYIKLVRVEGADWRGRAHFCAVAVTAMRQILQDYARMKRAEKRGGGEGERVPLETVETPSGQRHLDLVDLDEALSKLEEIDERQARVVEMRFFGGMTSEHVAEVLGVSVPTVERAWRASRAWLSTRLGSSLGDDQERGAGR